ncbi:hypothetical protein BGZ65_009839 [Modicella reniformis]|uniref:F-box domain-containing protein n=1 Tax=Modicella reniformis TaxID=1440133 RepID=A0A9P6MLA0_9FUNG|nr:hypothetical protein BGZ65_009839 [Modicella reniformis]
MPSSAAVASGTAAAATKAVAFPPLVYPSTPADTEALRQQGPLSLMSLPNECLTLLIQWVASQGVQDLFPLLCVNKRFFYLVVPLLYRDPFRLSARWVWKRSVYKGVIERQTKLIRTLLLCCTRTINKVTPIDPEAEKKKKTPIGRAMAVVRCGNHGNMQANDRRGDRVAPGPSSLTTIATGTTLDGGNRVNCTGAGVRLTQQKGDHSIFKSLFHKLGSSNRAAESKGEQVKSKGLQPKQSHLTKVEKIPIIWDAEKNQPETQRIPGLGRPSSSKLKFPPELTKTIIRLANEPPPMVNYLSYVTHTDVRSWSAASNMTLVHQILGDARPSWHARLQGFVKKTSKKIMGKHSTSDRQASGGATMSPIYDARQDLDDVDDEDDGGFDMAFNFRHNGRNLRCRSGRGTRNKNLWELRDIDFLELLLLFYTSGKMESLSLGMNCSHWYHPSLNVLLQGIPERLSGLRRIVIDHADTVMHNAVPVPQIFIQRHQKAFPGQLREIQVRQSYHYSYDMSKSVLQTIKTMERLEVLDLSIWTGVFSGLESICTDHLRKLLICHHMDVPRPEMFDELLKGCLVLEELSIVVPHPHLFSWAAERRGDLEGSLSGNGTRMTATSSRTATLWSDARSRRPANLPPLRTLTLFGHTPDVVSAFKDVIFAFQDTLESIQVSMYSDMTRVPETHFEVPPSHFVVTDEITQPSFFGVNILPSTGSFNNQPVASQSTHDSHNTAPEMSALWHQEILTSTNDGQQSSSSSGSTAPPRYLTWNWPLPRMRSTTASKNGAAGAVARYPRIMICDSLAFKWGMTVQEDRRSLILV